MKLILFVILIVLKGASALGGDEFECGSASITERILNGTVAYIDEFPWMALLEYERRNGSRTFECSGFLINERYILTAAHCVVGAIERQVGRLVGVRMGEYDTETDPDCIVRRNFVDCTDNVTNYGIEETIVHKAYKPRSKYDRANDIALIRLDKDVEFTAFAWPICLPSVHFPPSPVGKTFTVSGWGQTEKARRSNVKLKVGLPAYDFNHCSEIYLKANVELAESQMCAGGIYGQDSCLGDSGGPLMTLLDNQFVAEGIVSFGMGCGLDRPGIYTRVSSFTPWILENMHI